MPRRRRRNAANNPNQANNNANQANDNANQANNANRANDNANQANNANRANNNANRANNAPDAGDAQLTPYQGPDKAFGMFKCQKCNRFWMSSNSWANYGQDCRKCKINVYPFAQYPLESEEHNEKNKSDQRKPHVPEMCGKCKALGTNCAKIRRHRRRRRRQAADE